jgi:hypothetical protein
MALIKLRSEKTGKLYNAEGVSFVELCTDDNKLVGVVLVNEGMKLVELLRPGDSGFFKYTQTYKRDAGKVKDIDLTWLERKRNSML